MSQDFSTTKLWGRKWDLSVTLRDGTVEKLSTSASDPQALRITFEVLETTLPSPYWFAYISVYNLNDENLQNLLFNAAWVTLSAGYQTGDNVSSEIWKGPVMQTLYDRENVTDLIIRFNCIAAPAILEDSFFQQNVGPTSNQYQAVSKMIEKKNGVPSQQVSDYAMTQLQKKEYPRGKTFFGSSSDYIAQTAQDNFMTSYTKANQDYLTEMLKPGANLTPVITYAPPFPAGYAQTDSDDSSLTRSIIGVPKQSVFGCIFTVLLDPRLKVQNPPMVVKLDLTLIQQLKKQYGQLLTPLDKSGIFIAGQVRHYGDTRGNDWYTEVTGFSPSWSEGLLDGVFTAQPQ